MAPNTDTTSASSPPASSINSSRFVIISFYTTVISISFLFIGTSVPIQTCDVAAWLLSFYCFYCFFLPIWLYSVELFTLKHPTERSHSSSLSYFVMKVSKTGHNSNVYVCNCFWYVSWYTVFISSKRGVLVRVRDRNTASSPKATAWLKAHRPSAPVHHGQGCGGVGPQDSLSTGMQHLDLHPGLRPSLHHNRHRITPPSWDSKCEYGFQDVRRLNWWQEITFGITDTFNGAVTGSGNN